MKEREKVPIHKKLCITIEEAAEYSNIGESKIRELIKEPSCDFVLRKGAYTLIKRAKFERFIEGLEAI